MSSPKGPFPQSSMPPEPPRERWCAMGNDGDGERLLVRFYNDVKAKNTGLGKVDLEAAETALREAQFALAQLTRGSNEIASRRLELEKRRAANPQYSDLSKLAKQLRGFVAVQGDETTGKRADCTLDQLQSAIALRQLLDALYLDYPELRLANRTTDKQLDLVVRVAWTPIRWPRRGNPEVWMIRGRAVRALRQAGVPNYWFDSLLSAIGYGTTKPKP